MNDLKLYSLMKSIFLIAVSIAVLLLGIIGSGETYSTLFTVTYVLGVGLFLFGLIRGIITILSDKEEVQ